jgi:hypothetical protein
MTSPDTPTSYTFQAPAVLTLLPDWLRGATLTAHLERGRRVLMWTFHAADRDRPGMLFRNAYRQLWVTLQEHQLLDPDSPLWLSAERYLPGASWNRAPVTGTARRDMSNDLLPVFIDNPGGFDAVWSVLHQTFTDVAAPLKGLQEAERVVHWWRRKDWLTRGYAAGRFDLEPLADDDPMRRGAGVPVPSGYRSGAYPRVTVVARVMYSDPVDQVGWLAESGDLLPMAAILEGGPRV